MPGSTNHNGVLNATMPNVNEERVAKWTERSAVRLGDVRIGYVRRPCCKK